MNIEDCGLKILLLIIQCSPNAIGTILNIQLRSNSFTTLLQNQIHMLKSMTGFGRAEQNVGDKTFLVDIKSLNGKQFELMLKMPGFLKPFEFDIRRLISSKLGRGSIDCSISLKQSGSAKPVSINVDLAKAYYEPIARLSKELNLDTSQLLSSILKLPEVITPTGETLTPEEWKQFLSVRPGLPREEDECHHFPPVLCRLRPQAA